MEAKKKNKTKKLSRKSVSEKDAKSVKGGVGIKIGIKK